MLYRMTADSLMLNFSKYKRQSWEQKLSRSAQVVITKYSFSLYLHMMESRDKNETLLCFFL